jgi:hypothetical protein
MHDEIKKPEVEGAGAMSDDIKKQNNEDEKTATGELAPEDLQKVVGGFVGTVIKKAYNEATKSSAPPGIAGESMDEQHKDE